MTTKLYTWAHSLWYYPYAPYFKLQTTGSGASTTYGATTVSGGTEIPLMYSGTPLAFSSNRSPEGGWTFSGTFTLAFSGRVASADANVGFRARLFKLSGGVETEIGGGPWDSGVKLTTTNTTYTFTGTPTSTNFAENDHLVLRPYVYNIGTMGASSAYFSISSAGAYIELNETVTFKPIPTQKNRSDTFSLTFSESSTISGALSVSDSVELILPWESSTVAQSSVVESVSVGLTEVADADVITFVNVADTVTVDVTVSSIISLAPSVTDDVALTVSEGLDNSLDSDIWIHIPVEVTELSNVLVLKTASSVCGLVATTSGVSELAFGAVDGFVLSVSETTEVRRGIVASDVVSIAVDDYVVLYGDDWLLADAAETVWVKDSPLIS